MSVLGPISTLQSARPETYLDLDFSDGDTPGNLVYSRDSEHGVWDREGNYSVVGPNVPPITWVPELNSYALALEPARTNLYTTSANRLCGIGPFTSFTQSPDSIDGNGHLKTLIDAPDGSNTAIRVIGRSTGESQSSNVMLPAGRVLSFTFYARKAGTLAEFNVRLRAVNPDGSVLNTVSAGVRSFVDLDSAIATLNPVPGMHMTARKVSRGYVEIKVVVDGTATTTPLVEGCEMGFYLGYTGGKTNAISGRPYFDVWYGQAEAGGFPTSLIIPGPALRPRAGYSAHVPANVAVDFSIFSEYAVRRADRDFDDSIPMILANGAANTGRRFNSVIRRGSDGVNTLGPTGTVVQGNSSPYQWDIDARVVRIAGNCGWGRSDSSIHGGFHSQTGPADAAQYPISRVNFGTYLPHNFSCYVRSVRLLKNRIADLSAATRM
ncbi:phage head spike fiber domain-containing protein [Kerstersia gyiorum]|uniref:phage head spike fiber domain-containing protein n=1 Tax=Kerstersia gyiorum TaxID=206506 RepID=UPI0039ED79BD